MTRGHGPRTYLRAMLLALLVGSCLFAVPASASAGGISGQVTNADGNGLEGVCVFVDGDSGSGTALTDFLGRYTVGPLFSGKYTLRFNDCGRDNVAIEWYDNASSFRKAKPVKVKFGVITTGINAKLALTGDVFVKGPKKAKKGKKTVYKVTFKDTEENSPYKVNLRVNGKGVSYRRKMGKIQPGKSKTVKAKLRFKKTGKIKVRFSVTSATGGGIKSVKKVVRVKS